MNRFSILTELYNPKAFLTHAALLRQAFAHCAIFPTAASRRSLGRVSVPVWPINLSIRPDIVAMVGRYPTIKLMSRGPIFQRMHKKRHSFHSDSQICCAYGVLARISPGYPPQKGRSPTCYSPVRHFTRPRRDFLVQLACVRHAASVRSEPGSNSPSKTKRIFR